MQTIEQILVSFFKQAAKKDETQIKMLKQEPRFIVEPARWCFTLPDLYYFLQQHNDVFNHVDYKQFRRLIFNSPINTTIKPYGAEVTITDNQTKVDKSCYALVWLAME